MDSHRNMTDRVRRLIVRIKDQLRTFLGQESYSQEGEDVVLARIFDGRSTGFYVDIGCYHPIRYSNTYLFYRRGWRGINVDATPGVKTNFQKIRPRDINIESFVSADSSQRQFYLLSEPALNTASESLAAQRASISSTTKSALARPMHGLVHHDYLQASGHRRCGGLRRGLRRP